MLAPGMQVVDCRWPGLFHLPSIVHSLFTLYSVMHHKAGPLEFGSAVGLKIGGHSGGEPS